MACWSPTGTCGTRTSRDRRRRSPAVAALRRSTATSTTSRATGCSSSAPVTRAATWPSTRQRAARVDISVRRGQVFQPKAIFGRPRAELTWLAKLPAGVRSASRGPWSDVVVGPAWAYRGLPVPATRNLNDSPRSSTTCSSTGSSTAGSTCPGHRAARRRSRALHRRQRAEFDTILWATGFKVTLPFLDPALLHLARRRAAAHRRADGPGRARRTSTSSGWPPRAARSCRSTRRRPELVARMLRLTEATDVRRSRRSTGGAGQRGSTSSARSGARRCATHTDWSRRSRRTPEGE